MKAESSTIKQVSGACRLAGSWVISSITFLRNSTASYSRNQVRGDVCEPQHLPGPAPLYGHARHAIDGAAGLVLGNRVAAGAADFGQPDGAVTAHAGHDQGGGRRPEALGHR